MKKRNLLVIAVVLAAIAIITQLVNNRQKPSEDAKLNQPIVNAAMIDSVDEISIQNTESTTRIHQENGEWLIKDMDDFPADKEQLADLIEHLSTYRIASITSRDAKRHAYFNLLDPTTTQGQKRASSANMLTLKQKGQPILKLFVGKYRQSADAKSTPGADSGTYIRIDDNPNIYLIKENLRLAKTPNDWIKIDMFQIEEKEIQKIQFDIPNDRFALIRETPEDELTLPHNPDRETVDSFEKNGVLEELNPFMIEEIIPRTPEAEKGLELKSEITIALFDKTVIRFQILGVTMLNPEKEGEDKEETIYYSKVLPLDDPASEQKWGSLHRLSEKWIFQMNEWRAKEWLKKRSDFVKSKTESDS